jgi:hypothetical protein
VNGIGRPALRYFGGKFRLAPCDKPFISAKMLRTMRRWGRLKHMRVYGMGTELGFPVGFAVGALHFQKGYHGSMEISYYDSLQEAGR